jgi:hypothetical protein
MDGDVRIRYSRFTHNSGLEEVGAIFVSGGKTSIDQTTLSANIGDPAAGVLVDDDGNLAVSDSAFVENVGLGGGGGIFNRGGTAAVINTTFARNLISGTGGGEGIAILNFGSMSLTSNTFAENTVANLGVGLPASVIASHNTAILLQNSIVVHTGDPFVETCDGLVTSLGNNLISELSCMNILQSTDRVGDASLNKLADDGTPGNPHFPLLPVSQAISNANDAACPKKDQIGVPRRMIGGSTRKEFQQVAGWMLHPISHVRGA